MVQRKRKKHAHPPPKPALLPRTLGADKEGVVSRRQRAQLKHIGGAGRVAHMVVAPPIGQLHAKVVGQRRVGGKADGAELKGVAGDGVCQQAAARDRNRAAAPDERGGGQA